MRSLVVLSILSVLTGASLCSAQEGTGESTKDRLNVRVRSGGTGRYVFERWGAVAATLINPSTKPQKTLIVVTPTGGGLQFARRIEVPPEMSFDTSWPLLLSGKPPEQGPVDFQYLHFPGGVEDGVIRQEKMESELPRMTVLASKNPGGLSGYIPESSDPDAKNDTLMSFAQACRYAKQGTPGLASFRAQDIPGHAESLEPLDSLTLGDASLARYPQACSMLKLWVSRGGRLHIPLDVVGEEPARLLLGDSLPLTIVGETSANTIELEINPDYPKSQYPVRKHSRDYDEPVRYIRIVPGGGEVIWRVDGWPVAVRVPVGSGFILLTTIDLQVFIEQRAEYIEGASSWIPIPSMRRVVDTMFETRTRSPIQAEPAGSHAADLIGYSIPGQSTAFLLLSIFPVALLIGGIWLLRKSAGEKLIWVIPCLAVAAAVPSIASGLRVRSVAPETLIETRVVQAASGANEISSDGYASVYLPGPRDLPVSSQSGTILAAVSEAANMDYRRLVWSDATNCTWEKLNQPAGLKTYPLRAVRQLDSQLKVIGTFDENGFRAHLLAPGFPKPSDLVIAGQTPDRMTARILDDGTLQATADDVLENGQFWATTLTSEEQRQRNTLMESVFSQKDRIETFPTEPTLLFWESSAETLLSFSSENARRIQNTLVIQPIRWMPPPAGRTITIPSPLMAMRSVETDEGGMGGIFNNSRREWVPLENGSESRFEFWIPAACRPFEMESATVRVRMRAGSRTVQLLAGVPGRMEQVAEYQSPLGEVTAEIPAELLKLTGTDGRLYLQFNVSNLAQDASAEMNGEQDDQYRIDRCLLTVKGHRLDTTVAQAK